MLDNPIEWLQLECNEVKKRAWHVRENAESCRYYVRPRPSAACVTSTLAPRYFNDVAPQA
jgi:hypothetical protein